MAQITSKDLTIGQRFKTQITNHKYFINHVAHFEVSRITNKSVFLKYVNVYGVAHSEIRVSIKKINEYLSNII